MSQEPKVIDLGKGKSLRFFEDGDVALRDEMAMDSIFLSPEQIKQLFLATHPEYADKVS